MQAALFEAAGKPLKVENTEIPVPGPGEVLLKVGRCGVCGTDLHMTEGHPPIPAGTILGHEFAGEVVDRGPGVTNVAIGDRVAVMPLRGCGHCAGCLAGKPIECAELKTVFGGFAEYATARERECIKLPGSLSLADGALIEPLAVALHGVAGAGITPGTNVMVIGAGPIGLGVIYWAQRSGAKHITVIEGRRARLDLAMTIGATECLMPEPIEIGPADMRVSGRVLGEDGPDVVFECVGLPGLLNQAIKRVKVCGTVVSLGCCAKPDPLIPIIANIRETTIKFPIGYSLREFQTVVDSLDAGHVEPRGMVTDTISLSALPAEFEALRTGSSQCKLMIEPGRAG